MFEGETVLVTGGSGLIGSHIIRLLLKRGANVRTVIHERPLPLDLEGKIEVIQGDLQEPETCRQAVKNVKHVFHCAAFVGGVKQNVEHPATMITRNLLINSNVIEYACQAGVERYAFMSCSCVYPDIEGELSEDMAWTAPPPPGAIHFGWSKRIGELQAQAYHEEYGLKVAIVRPGNSYGPGDLYDEYRSHVIPALIMKAVGRQKPFKIWGSGTSKRDFIYAEDVAEGTIMALERYAVADPINLSTGKPVSINELAQLILRLSGYEDAEVVHEHPELTGSKSKVLSPKKAVEKLGFHPKTSLEEGLKKTIQAYKASLNLK